MFGDDALISLYRPIFVALSERNAWDVDKDRGRLTKLVLRYSEIGAPPLALLPTKPRHLAVIDGRPTWYIDGDHVRGGPGLQ